MLAIYRLSTSGAETVLHSFAGSSDGERPGAELLDVKGALYGTTALEGAPYGAGEGTVFASTP
ncbi:MAG: hypothetical protein JOZ77_03510 [Candidatus Eremiobacteraeota bacterium]|nr:hypothetical protein [Candidatus Eremiobacteraeota bacterium]